MECQPRVGSLAIVSSCYQVCHLSKGAGLIFTNIGIPGYTGPHGRLMLGTPHAGSQF